MKTQRAGRFFCDSSEGCPPSAECLLKKNLRRKHIARHYVYVCTVKDHERGPCAQPVNNEQQTTN